jgi:hypothetical protein
MLAEAEILLETLYLLFVGRLCSFFTQGSELYGLSGMALEHGAPPDFRGYILRDEMLLLFPTEKEAEVAGPDRLFLDLDVVNAAAAWGIPELGFFPGACVRVQYDNPLVIGADEAESENDLFTQRKVPSKGFTN